MKRSRFLSLLSLPLLSSILQIPLLFSQPINYKIAFIGDQGLGEDAEAVLQLIKDEGTSAVVHAGDFDYDDNPTAWENQINEILGSDFPYFAAVGNHDEDEFYGTGGYQEFMMDRMNRLGIAWDGDLGVNSSLNYEGIFFVLTGPDVLGENHADYIKDKLAEDNSIWSISCWHKNMTNMQVGGKGNDTGWEVYEESRKGGAIIATAHEHSYSRTHLLSNIENQVVASTSNTLVLNKDAPETIEDEGRTFVFVSGLGGKSIRDQERDGAWWASIYTSDQNATDGALFGVFNVDGVINMANFYFKDVNGLVVDEFTVISEVEGMPVPVELSLFEAQAERDFVTLNWQTRTETNNLGFHVERSRSGQDFDKIAFVRGNGTTTSPKSYVYTDTDLEVGAYIYRLRQIDLDGTFSYSPAVHVEITKPESFSLSQNYPNPFNPETTIRFEVPKEQKVTLRIFNSLGQEVWQLEDNYIAGYHDITWGGRDDKGRDLATGVYIYQLHAGTFSDTKKMLLLR